MPVPATLGNFTGELATELSYPGNVALALAATGLVPPVDLVLLEWHAEPVRLGWSADSSTSLLWCEAVATEQNWEMYLGEDKPVACFPEVPGGPITSWTITLTIKNSSGTTVITKTATIDDGPNGIFSWTMNRSDTAALAAGNYTYDVWRTDSGFYTELLIGRLTLLQPVGP